MPTVNKQSVREEFDRLKSEFEQLSANKQIAPEIATLFNGLMMLLNIMFSIFLEKQTKKTSKNSNIPPSQTQKDESSIIDSKTNGKGKSEKMTTAANTRTVESVEVIPVEYCDCCGEDLSKSQCKAHERRTRIDIIFEKTVEHKDAEIKECPNCFKLVKAVFPSDLKGPLQYGNGIKAYVIQLLTAQMISLNRAQKMLATLIGKMISEATMLGYIMLLFFALERWEESAKTDLLKLPCINVDETSLRVDKKNYWIHSYSGHDITLKLLHRKRGKDAMNEFNIIPRYGGVLVHDCWFSYLSYNHCLHALCGSHLLRELTYIVDANNYAWAKNIKLLLQKACLKVSESKEKCLSEKEYNKLQKRYSNILTRGEKELPPIPESKKGRRGKIAKSDAHNLWERLEKYEKEVLLFSKLPSVPFTNNRAERDLRMSKVKQKVSGCFRTEKYAKAYCRISSYLQTMNNKGINPMIAIQMALSGEIYK
jgi:transposase